VSLVQTDPAHIGGGLGGDEFTGNREQFQVRPAGNAVSLEDEMMKVASNQMDYQAASALYGRSLGLIKMALGK
jgi:flagellar basal-body rod protein FlgB